MKDYKILSATSRGLLEADVTEYLTKGYTPHGSLQTIEDTIIEGAAYARYTKKVIRYIQPVIKTI